MRLTVIVIVVAALKLFLMGWKIMEVKGRIDTIHTTALLRRAIIFRRVFYYPGRLTIIQTLFQGLHLKLVLQYAKRETKGSV